MRFYWANDLFISALRNIWLLSTCSYYLCWRKFNFHSLNDAAYVWISMIYQSSIHNYSWDANYKEVNLTYITGGSAQYEFSQKIGISAKNWAVLACITSLRKEKDHRDWGPIKWNMLGLTCGPYCTILLYKNSRSFVGFLFPRIIIWFFWFDMLFIYHLYVTC